MTPHVLSQSIRTSRKLILAAGVASAAMLLSLPARADEIPAGGKSSNLEVVGFTGLNGRPGAFKLALKHTKNDKCYL